MLRATQSRKPSRAGVLKAPKRVAVTEAPAILPRLSSRPASANLLPAEGGCEVAANAHKMSEFVERPEFRDDKTQAVQALIAENGSTESRAEEIVEAVARRAVREALRTITGAEPATFHNASDASGPRSGTSILHSSQQM